ncbi:MAG: TIGR00282 family metallophosphoesterase [Candidatus Buchananbacteria bacterium CG10_big_fil_rev_8_21_14_0_10_42_9]|uniref:TIGR00282 family metallophosphoesterase n=1 Tax=Candidatus Buchananbacteria bacterium CG10_big_fil_rev_8_21_14_0_10_42_9 TaxID=1974526 RepID=A0A2H0W0S5_9BACT|nr:MAG: TIGR00282 family metallophosphoesterase [Candidatus Buchananbacteria bacterium CG10_big_fil_rev_8_21_14_0_10_42_9]
MKILFFGDVNGRIARAALRQAIPEYKKNYQPNLILANVENAAHGAGITEKVYADLCDCEIDFFTSGNHIFDKGSIEAFKENPARIIRPANFPPENPGKGFEVLTIGKTKVAVINLMGQVFTKEEYSDPFIGIDKILDELKIQSPDVIIVDFHAEATSEKSGFGHYVDGRVSAVVGTHTHVPTADAKVLPKGTAFVTDIGMVGAKDSVIGITKESAMKIFIGNKTKELNLPEQGEVQIGAVLIEIDAASGKSIRISRVDTEIEV